MVYVNMAEDGLAVPLPQALILKLLAVNEGAYFFLQVFGCPCLLASKYFGYVTKD